MSHTITFSPTKKQHLIFEAFEDEHTTEVLYGGSAGAAKSYGLCALIIIKCLQYPGIRVGLARNELTTLKKTTIVSFFEVATDFNLSSSQDFFYNSSAGTIKFSNGSEVVLMELTHKPSDPEFTRLGGQLLTFGCIDEIGEVNQRGFHIFKSRLGRWKNSQTGIKPIVVSTCNPSKGWIYNEYYKPYTDDALDIYKKFIQALPTDNPYISQEYLDNLGRLPMADKQRLLYGNWDFDSTDYDLFDHSFLTNAFYHSSKKISSQRYITIDPASMGKDKTAITFWIGYDCLRIVELDKADTNEIINQVKSLMTANNVPIRNVIVDRVGIGVGVYDGLKGCQGFVANAIPFNKEPFANLKSQLYYKFAELINKEEIGIVTKDYMDDICIQLEAHKRYNVEADRKAEVTPKNIVKQMIGKSPDLADALVMRAYFEFSSGAPTVVVGPNKFGRRNMGF